jgi:hypothetical protein
MFWRKKKKNKIDELMSKNLPKEIKVKIEKNNYKISNHEAQAVKTELLTDSNTNKLEVSKPKSIANELKVETKSEEEEVCKIYKEITSGKKAKEDRKEIINQCFNVFILGRHCHTLLEWLGFIGTWIIILILFFTPIYSLKNESIVLVYLIRFIFLVPLFLLLFFFPGFVFYIVILVLFFLFLGI